METRHRAGKWIVATLIGWIVAAGAPAVGLAAGNHAEADEARGGASGGAGLEFGAGVRVGGYGFRGVRDGTTVWDDCRMNGAGVFGTVDFNDTFFAELSLEVYHATGKAVAHEMDRLSVHTLAATGARLFPDFVVSPYFQLGVGPEWTTGRVDGVHFQRLLVAPFFGLGAEVKISDLRLGANLRSFVMGVPRHGVAHTHVEGRGGPSGLMIYEVAGQAQFFARYVF